MTALVVPKPSKPQILIKRTYDHSINDLWEALTNAKALSVWLMKTDDFELIEGREFMFTTKPQGGFDGKVYCKVVGFSKPNSLTYSWKSKDMKNPTYVTWELTKVSENKTFVSLSHSGFEGINGWITKQILGFGWKGILSKKLNKYLKG